VLRAIDWEHRAFETQREILEEEFKIRVTDDEFTKENLINLADATYRALTGHFSSPGDLGIEPVAVNPAEVLSRAKRILRDAAQELGLQEDEGGDTKVTAGTTKHYRVTIPLPVADGSGYCFPEAIVRWFENGLLRIGSGFRKHHQACGVWETDGSVLKEEVTVYVATIETGRFCQLAGLLEEARRVFHQSALLVEVARVDKFLLTGSGAEALEIHALARTVAHG
jgi:hypothetical protein